MTYSTANVPQYVESGEVARSLGVSVETLRYWERVGKIDPPARTTRGTRIFTAAQVESIRQSREESAGKNKYEG